MIYYSPQYPLYKPPEVTDDISKHRRSTIEAMKKDLISWDNIKILGNCTSINLSNNLLENFYGLPELQYLTKLQLDNNPLTSFEGSVPLPKLRWLSMRNTPLSRNKYFNIMCLVAFGNQLTTINGEKVSDSTRSQAEKLKKTLLPQLRLGYLISNMRPIRLSHIKREEIIVPEADLIEAASNVTYTTKGEKELSLSLIEDIRQPRATVAVLVDILDESGDLDFLPKDIIHYISTKLKLLREKYDNPSTDDDTNEENDQTEIMSNEYVEIDSQKNGENKENYEFDKNDNKDNENSKEVINDNKSGEISPKKENNAEEEEEEEVIEGGGKEMVFAEEIEEIIETNIEIMESDVSEEN